MEGAGIVRTDRHGELTRASPARLAAGIAVLALLAAIAVLLAPPYYENWQFQQYLRAFVRDSEASNKTVDYLQALVVDKAASMGLPVHLTDVHVTKSGAQPSIEVLYVVHVNLPLYSVDLHFRPTA